MTPPPNSFYFAEYMTTLSIGQFVMKVPNPKMLTIDDFEDAEALMDLLSTQINRWKTRLTTNAVEPKDQTQ